MKTSLEISHSTTINLGGYNTIKPTVIIRMDDIDVEKVPKISTALSKLVSNMWAMEVISIADEMEAIEKMEFQNYTKELRKKKTEIKEQTKLLWKYCEKEKGNA